MLIAHIPSLSLSLLSNHTPREEVQSQIFHISDDGSEICFNLLPLFIMQLSATAVTKWHINEASFLFSSLKCF